MPDERAVRELIWIKEVRRINAEIQLLKNEFMRNATNYRAKVEMENSFAEASGGLNKFIDGVLEGQFNDNNIVRK